eukprot:g13505.t1
MKLASTKMMSKPTGSNAAKMFTAAPSSSSSAASKSGAQRIAQSGTDDPFLRVVRGIPKGAVWSFQEVAAAAERQGQGGMMRASSLVHAIDAGERELPWWRVVYKPGPGKPLINFLQRTQSRASAQELLLKKDGINVNVPLPEKKLAFSDAALVVRGADLKSFSANAAGKNCAIFAGWPGRVANAVAEVERGLGVPTTSTTQHLAASSGSKSSKSLKGFPPIRVPGVFTPAEVGAILDWAAEERNRDRTVRLEKHNFGCGIYHYLAEEAFSSSTSSATSTVGASSKGSVEKVGASLSQLRAALFRSLLTRARGEETGREQSAASMQGFKGHDIEQFHKHCQKHGQSRPSSLILYYRKGGVNFPHRDLFGTVAFPFQVLVLLCQPGKDFQGGEFFTMDTKTREKHMHTLEMGDLLIFDPINVTHGMTQVTQGKRSVFGFVFHLAK